MAWQDDFNKHIAAGEECPVCTATGNMIYKVDYSGFVWYCEMPPANRTSRVGLLAKLGDTLMHSASSFINLYDDTGRLVLPEKALKENEFGLVSP